MKKLKQVLSKECININKYQFINDEEIIDTDKGKYIIKVKKNNIKEIYEYLLSRNFTNFLKIENSYNDPYEIYRYTKDNITNEDKGIDLVHILSSLHNKTTTYQEIDIDKVKTIYEEINSNINKLNNYYLKLQDKIENHIYMAPAEYLLIRNINKIYQAIDISRNNINKWYEIKKNNKQERIALIHNNISLNNFIDKSKNIKNWDYAKKDYVVYDFYKFYKNNFEELEFNSLFNLYQSKYKYTEDESLLFMSLIFKPWIVEFNSSNYDNCIKVKKLINYVEKTKNTFLKENHKNQKTNDNKLN